MNSLSTITRGKKDKRNLLGMRGREGGGGHTGTTGTRPRLHEDSLLHPVYTQSRPLGVSVKRESMHGRERKADHHHLPLPFGRCLVMNDAPYT